MTLTVLWLGPDEWLVVAPPGARRSLESRSGRRWGPRPAPWSTSRRNRTTVELAGPRARDVLAKGCSLDLHPSVFREGSCAADAAGAGTGAAAVDGGDDASYWLLVRASFATYLVDWLLDASSEYAEGDS